MSNEQPRWTPPRWLNALMCVMLKTPGLQRLVGRGTALVRFEGRKSGRPFETPISYTTVEDRVLLTGHATRQWWRNLASDHYATVRLAGRERSGRVSVSPASENIEGFVEFLRAQPMVAKANSVEIAPDGTVNRGQAAAAAEHTVIVEVDLTDAPGPVLAHDV